MKYYTIEDGDGIRDISEIEFQQKVKNGDFFNILGEYEFTLMDLCYEKIC